ncbi:hypothetical protein DEFR109230_01390 [Deinococcus frigens]
MQAIAEQFAAALSVKSIYGHVLASPPGTLEAGARGLAQQEACSDSLTDAPDRRALDEHLMLS